MRPAAQGRFPELKSVQSHATLARCLSSASETPRPYHACGNDGREVGRLVGVAARNVVKGLWNLARRRQSHLLGDDVQHRLLRVHQRILNALLLPGGVVSVGGQCQRR